MKIPASLTNISTAAILIVFFLSAAACGAEKLTLRQFKESTAEQRRIAISEASPRLKVKLEALDLLLREREEVGVETWKYIRRTHVIYARGFGDLGNLFTLQNNLNAKYAVDLAAIDARYEKAMNALLRLAPSPEAQKLASQGRDLFLQFQKQFPMTKELRMSEAELASLNRRVSDVLATMDQLPKLGDDELEAEYDALQPGRIPEFLRRK